MKRVMQGASGVQGAAGCIHLPLPRACSPLNTHPPPPPRPGRPWSSLSIAGARVVGAPRTAHGRARGEGGAGVEGHRGGRPLARHRGLAQRCRGRVGAPGCAACAAARPPDQPAERGAHVTRCHGAWSHGRGRVYGPCPGQAGFRAAGAASRGRPGFHIRGQQGGRLTRDWSHGNAGGTRMWAKV